MVLFVVADDCCCDCCGCLSVAGAGAGAVVVSAAEGLYCRRD